MFAMGPGFVKSGGGAGGGTTWNPADKGSNITLSNGNLTAGPLSGTAYQMVRGTTSKNSGKWYFEVACVTTGASNFAQIGLAPSTTVLAAGYPGVDANSWGYYQQTGQKYTNATASTYGTGYVATDVIGVAVDFTAGKIWFAKNNTWQASGNPAGNTGEAFSGLTGVLFPSLGLFLPNAGTFTGKFKAADQTYAPPSGFTAWG